MKKNAEEQSYADKASRNLRSYESGEEIPLTTAGQLTANEAISRQNSRTLATNMGIINNAVAQRNRDDTMEANFRRQLSNSGSSTDVTPAPALRWMAEQDSQNAQSLAAQRAANAARAKQDGDNAAAADAAYSSRYAAAQAADAQRYAAQMQLIGNLSQPGNYKYWGG